MELRYLRYFVAVVEEQSFTKAAERLFIAQPPLSRQIQNLENELGVQLFERGSRPLQTTTAGQFLYQHALKLLSNAEEVKSMTKRIGLIERTLTIGFVGSLLFGLLPRIIYLYRQQHPNLNIQLVELSTTEQIQALKEGKIDVGFGRLRISDPAVKRVLLRKERLVVAAHSSHPIAQRIEGVYLADLVEEKLFLYPNTPKPNFSSQLLNIFAEHSLVPKHVRELREIQLALGLVAAGEGLCIIPASADTIRFPHLVYIPILDSDAVSPIFITARAMDKSGDLQSLFDCIYHVYDLEGIPYQRTVFILDNDTEYD
ncbi:LysR family transcriptional regulator [Acinetobacter sp. NIPH 2699]|uniref:LysR family transcriptional regulator n=1 Tax=Acinetobacter sp. NIPH 2699 TaxID=2923433 RepID=UPI001F4B482F|nr:LysR family transcriptional regulator [Acinetobacter sp. NIPH 2699]MCH7335912.1 LysR substrate-binding domain-containing protein [Acinetobacter sp. NIPH 2699]